MDLAKVSLNKEINTFLDRIYEKLKRMHPEFNESLFMELVITEWAEPYKIKENNFEIYTKDDVILKNYLKKAFEMNGRSQIEVSKEIGINRVYLNEIINEKSEPSITIGLLLEKALGFPIKDLFYLKKIRT